MLHINANLKNNEIPLHTTHNPEQRQHEALARILTMPNFGNRNSHLWLMEIQNITAVSKTVYFGGFKMKPTLPTKFSNLTP